MAKLSDRWMYYCGVLAANGVANGVVVGDLKRIQDLIDAEEQGLLVRLPCKIGDTVWGIRAYKGIKQPQQGIVGEMYFLPDMSLQIVIKHVCRGAFGKTVFLTREEAEQALKKREDGE